MDETLLWLDMPGDTTVSHTGEHSVTISATGHDKGWFTVILAAIAEGKKFKPFVVFKGVQPIAAFNRSWSCFPVQSKLLDEQGANTVMG